MEKAKEFQKNINFSFIDYAVVLTDCCGSQQTGKFLKRWAYQTTLPVSWETCIGVKKQQLKLDMQYQIRKGVGQGCVLSPCLLNLPGWMNHNLESRLLREISAILDMQMIPL